jgi:hypothetical protein
MRLVLAQQAGTSARSFAVAKKEFFRNIFTFARAVIVCPCMVRFSTRKTPTIT